MNPYQSPAAADTQDSRLKNALVPADRMTRLAAYGIDLLIHGAAYFSLHSFTVQTWLLQLETGAMSPFAFLLKLAALSGVVYLILNSYFLYQSGQTIGKKILDIQIVRSDGQVPGPGWLLLRRVLPTWFMYWCPLLNVLLFPLDSLLILRESRQCLHDQIADTLVVRVKTSP